MFGVRSVTIRQSLLGRDDVEGWHGKDEAAPRLNEFKLSLLQKGLAKSARVK